MADEGVGIRAIERLEQEYVFPGNVELMDGGTSGIELLRFIDGRDALIILDCVKADHPPGTLLRAEGDDVPAQFRTRISPHQLGLSDLLATAALTGAVPKHLILLGVEPKEVTLRLEMSEEVKAGLDRLVARTVEEVRALGCEVTPTGIAPESVQSSWNNP